MKELLMSALEGGNNLSMEQVLLRFVISLVIGLLISVSYGISNAGTIYSRKFNFTLLMLTMLTTGVMTVIGSNLALSLGMVGALSIVRFRTAIKDSRDTAYIFWTIIAGICCGSGDFDIAAIFSGGIFLLTVIFGHVRADDRMLLIIRGERESAAQIEAIVFKYFGTKAKMRVKNTSKKSAEMIYELSSAQIRRSEKNRIPIVDALYEMPGIEYVNMVAQNDDIRS